MTTNTLEKYQFKIQMDKWLTQFNTYDEYENFLDSQDCPRLNVSYVVDDDQTYYFKDNTSTNFFTMKFTTDWHVDSYIKLPGKSIIYKSEENLYEAEYAKIRVKKNGETEFGDWGPYNGGSFDTGDTIQLSVKYKDEYLNTENTYAAYLQSPYDGNEHRAEISGNIMSMIYGDDFLLYDSKDKFKFSSEWKETVSKADNLSMPRIITQKDCCANMFDNTPITSLPKLPAKTVPEGCYQWIFGGCQNLTDLSSYKLDAKYVTDNSLLGMFNSCSYLTLPPQFNTLTFSAGAPIPYLFNECNNLERTANIDLIYDGDGDPNFDYIYAGCSSLTDEHERHIRIDQKNLKYIYSQQKNISLTNCFQNCSSMTKTPKIINFRIGGGCFDGCTSLTEIYYANPMNPVTDVGLFSDMPQTGTLFYPYFAKYKADSFNEAWRNQWSLQKMWYDELDNFMMWTCVSGSGGGDYDPYFNDMAWTQAGVFRDDRMQYVFVDEGPGANWTQYDCFNTINRVDWEHNEIAETVDVGGWTATGDQVKGYDVYIANNQWREHDVYAVYNPDANWPEFFTQAHDSWTIYVMEFATKPSWLS